MSEAATLPVSALARRAAHHSEKQLHRQQAKKKKKKTRRGKKKGGKDGDEPTLQVGITSTQRIVRRKARNNTLYGLTCPT